ncbi:hypothetical protein LR48_Vigan11g058000 [Vigna angularis]|uniref:Ubiquitin-like protease family profile domain-containing protein n=1 Tax=Phaseolus angularis TaxID=3914 RepID=A0A0L9VRR5_PHAAN|nr:hypothetical protein LR48_Vigan11g058000 [Vigna angularis]
MTSSSAALISQRIFTRPQKEPIHDTIIHEDDDMAEAEDDPLSKLMTRLPRLKKAPLKLYYDLRVFALPPHVPVYITLSNALEVIGGDRMLNISIIQLWCMYMDTIVVDQGRSSMYGFVEPQTIQPSDDDMAEAEDDPLSKLMTRLPRLKKAPLKLYYDLRVFALPPHVPVYITLSNALEVIGGDRMLNISIIQLWCMYMDTIVVDQGRSSMYGFVEPQTIQPSGNTLEKRALNTRNAQCIQQLDSWECGFYVMCWIKTIIRAVITDDCNERFKSTSPILEDTIKQIRQEWTAYLLQRWS